MGVDISAIMSCRFQLSELVSFPERLNTAGGDLEVAVRLFEPLQSKLRETSSWDFDHHGLFVSPEHEWTHESWVTLNGPAGFCLHVGDQLMELHHWTRFRHFLQYDGIQAGIIAACRGILKLIGGDTVVYLPDSGC